MGLYSLYYECCELWNVLQFGNNYVGNDVTVSEFRESNCEVSNFDITVENDKCELL